MTSKQPNCSICRHPQRNEIDAALIARQSLRAVARQYATTKDSLSRHNSHLPEHLAVAKQAAEVASADSLLDQAQGLLARATRLADRAEHAKNLSVALQGVKEIRGVLELLGKLSGELRTQQVSQVNAVQVNWRQQLESNTPEENERRVAELLNKAGLAYVPLQPTASLEL